LTEEEAREREERVLKAGLVPEGASTTTITLLKKATADESLQDDGRLGSRVRRTRIGIVHGVLAVALAIE
jgi:hypothetical protein